MTCCSGNAARAVASTTQDSEAAPVDSQHADRVSHRLGYHCVVPEKGDASGVHPNIHASLIQAIEHKNFVTLVMRDHTEASGEPHVYGKRAVEPMVLLYNSEEDPAWQLVDVRNVAHVKIWLDEHFDKRELPAEYDPDKGTH
jgi:hypothetical protein